MLEFSQGVSSFILTAVLCVEYVQRFFGQEGRPGGLPRLLAMRFAALIALLLAICNVIDTSDPVRAAGRPGCGDGKSY